MSDNKGHTPYDPQASLMDTQRLLQGLEPLEGTEFSLEDILAEYGSAGAGAADAVPETPAAPEEPAAEEETPGLPEEQTEEKKEGTAPRRGKTILFPGPAYIPEEEEENAPAEAPAVLRADNEIDDISPEDLFGIVRQNELYPEEEEIQPVQETGDAEKSSGVSAGQQETVPEEKAVPITM